MIANYYEILDITPDADEQQIKKAYRLNAVKYHPDKNSGENEFVQEFIKIQEAYDTLNNAEKRKKYDIEWNTFFGVNQPHTSHSAQQDKDRRQKDSHQSFYSGYNRYNDDTPQVYPTVTPWNEPITRMIFFALPQKIGTLIGGYSTYREGHKKLSFFKFIAHVLKSSLTAAIIIGAIMGILYLVWTSNHVNTPGQKALIGFSIFYGIALIIIFAADSNLHKFKQLNYYIGINGFAYFMSEGTKDNIIEKFELNFKSVTHLFTSEVRKYKGLQYKETAFSFVWFNNNRKEILFKTGDSHRQKEGDPPKQAEPYYWMNRMAEKSWTIYLLDNLERELSEKGYIQFDIDLDGSISPFVRLAVGKITMLNNTYTTYNLSDIKKVYLKKGNLYFEHINYSKRFIFFERGEKDFIPLSLLGNKQFFMKSLEILLGYSFAQNIT
ncbi:MAG TPA: J domain-containing protein [Chitinophagaceae bacterium]|jgi:hypothetical protein